MNREFVIKEQFNDFCADGDKARNYLIMIVVPWIEANPDEMIVFDFDGIKRINSSFANALLGNAFALYGKDRIRIKNLREELKTIIIAALVYGESLRHDAEHLDVAESIVQRIKNIIGIK